ncbi:hypothetical protein QTN47_09140 [Danxiaibacter flavus]|uniref:Type VI secretion, VasB, ImpH, VC_A0111 n=1 Tax=Danxiaibacter flavus TaxID=3049108 RepID=A0ABV3ZDR0_9BACT|nr:hypothetical protein QNM32_09140 [Chitinophagaceae bacterium DXS]
MQPLINLEADFKTEVIAALLVAGDQDVSRIILERLGNNPRPYSKDIHHIYEHVSAGNLSKHTIFQTYRQSIYEALPESLFHPPTLGEITMTEAQAVEEIRLQRRREHDARIFFRPFEQESSYVEISALLIELMYEQKGRFNNLFYLFGQAWPIINRLPEETALCFIYILPILHEVRGNRKWIEQCLSFLLNRPIMIDSVYNVKEIIASDNFSLNVCRLGIDSSLGGLAYYDGVPEWNICIGPVHKENICSVLPQSEFFEVLEMLTACFIPDFVFSRYTIITQKEGDTFLSANQDYNGRLGHTFYL